MIVTYSCPHCRAQLEAQFDGWDGWMRCPACGRASLPPEPVNFGDATRGVGVPNSDDTAPASAHSAAVPTILEDPGQNLALSSDYTSPARLIFTTGCVSSFVLALLAFLDMRPVPAAIFGFLTVTFFLMLLRRPRKRAVPWSSRSRAE